MLASSASSSSRFIRFVSLSAVAAVLVAGSVGCGPAPQKDDGPTACPADIYEPNSTQETAKDLGALQDDPNSAKDIESSVHLGTDTDWFKLHVADTGLGGDPVINVAISPGFKVTTWFACDEGRALESKCVHGSSDYARVGDVEGCRGEPVEPEYDENGARIGEASFDSIATTTTDCSGTSSDSGTLYVRVERSPNTTACSYGVSIHVE